MIRYWLWSLISAWRLVYDYYYCCKRIVLNWRCGKEMARMIRFALEIADGKKVRSMDELRECFDAEKYYGILLTVN